MIKFLTKTFLKGTGLGLTIKELNDYKRKMNAEGKDPFSPKNFINEYGKPLYDKLKNAVDKTVEGKAMGGMMEARKKGMGLRMANGGEAKFPDLSGDGKITQKDILMGRGVIKKAKGGVVKKRATRTKKSRGSGAAIKGTKFKGVF
tara:strand:- start:2 stop:439 length:438 start_codon:yes stop_codon:yes gene_type:complete